ncbi:MAG: argininosuccinate lyase [Alphaproteobacteria bacterium]|nr:MAG: argininosuccinate lyase [Alphaproteobacteria bacterium]
MAQKPLTKVSVKSNSQKTNTIWGGRFSASPAAVMEQINVSIDFDKRLYRQDIAASLAHCKMLISCKIISAEDGKNIANGLHTILGEIESNQFPFRREYEDIHMNIEARLAELIGDAAGRLHTARSRNDQAVTDFRLFVRDAIDVLDRYAQNVQKALIDKAEQYADAIMPGYTHFQAAQPVTFGHHLMAYVEMLGRDRGRLADCRARLNECPLGAAALAGTSFPIDRHKTAEDMGFDAPMANSMDAVASRDFALEFLSCLSIMSVHLSRFAEELIVWSNDRFNFIALPESMTSGSSIMPQKRNPDAAELVRGKAGKIAGNLQSLLMLLKGLPLAYNKDLQDDKPITFAAIDDMVLCLNAMQAMVEGMHANITAMRAAADGGFATATDLADYIVQKLNLPFRKAHHIVGALVKLAEKKKCGLAKLSLADLQSVEPKLTKEAFNTLDIDLSVGSRDSFGGTAPKRVRESVKAARKKYL